MPCRSALRTIKPIVQIPLWEWADQNIILSREASSERGEFRSERTPFIREPLEALSTGHKCSMVTVVKPTQQGGTMIGTIFFMGMIALNPGPMLWMMPTNDMAKSFSKKRFQTIMNCTPCMDGLIAEKKSRDSQNTILEKMFPGGSVKLSGANSGASFRSEAIKFLCMDDFDEFEMNIDEQGDPAELADRRTGSFPGRKMYFNSTTTLKHFSNIERVYETSSQGKFCVPCPHCGEYQYLTWGSEESGFGMRFTYARGRDQIKEAWYQCEHCQARIDEHHKGVMIERGKYIHKYPERLDSHAGFRYNAMVAPIGWVNTWKYIAEKFLVANRELKQGNPQKYIAWLNTLMAEPYEEAGEQPSWALLKAKCEPYRELIIPPGVRMLSAGVDVHATRLDVTLFGWGTGEECWVIYHNSIIGDVQFQDPWDQLDGLLLHRTFEMHNGGNMTCLSIGVDAGDGNTTQAVRNYCRYRSPRVFALKGASTMGKPIVSPPTLQDLTWQGEKIENGVEMWTIGTDTAKSTLYSRFKIDTAGPGRIHFYIGLEDEYFQQLTAEKVITRFVKGYPVREWHNIRGNKANHALDTMVYGYAAAIRAGLPFMAPDVPGRPAVHKKPRPVRPKSDNRKGRFW